MKKIEPLDLSFHKFWSKWAPAGGCKGVHLHPPPACHERKYTAKDEED